MAMRATTPTGGKMLADDRVQLFDNGGPNDAHAEPCIAAAQAGKHILCEKPLARTAEEAKDDAGCGAEGRRQAHGGLQLPLRAGHPPDPQDLIESGALGRIYHFRAVYLQEWIMPHYNTPMIWRLQKSVAGSGALGDLGAHIIDLARFLVGDVKSVSAMTKTFIPERPWGDGTMGKVDVDDAFAAVVEFENGAHRHARSDAALPPGARTTTRSRSTARRAASASTWSA